MSKIPPGALVRDRELPELGPGRIVAELAGGASRIRFEQSDEIRDVQVSQVEVNRLPLIPGTPVQVRSGRYGDEETAQGVVVDAELPDSADELCDYIVDVDGEQWTVSEAELFPIGPQSTDPRDQFEALHWRGPFRFFARWGMHRMVSRMYEDAEGLPSLVGARIEPKTHQIYAIRRVLWSQKPRMVLGDPSPTDRLLEAGAAVQALTWENPELKTLVVAPGGRVREWRTQLNMRFGGRDWPTLNRNEAASSAFDVLADTLEGPRLIIPPDVIERVEDVQMLLGSTDWDCLVVDDAHRIDTDTAAFTELVGISERAGAAFVTASLPPEPDVELLNPLFSLARPSEYSVSRPEALSEEVDASRPVWTCLQETVAAAPDAEDADTGALAEQWRDVAGGDARILELADELEDGDAPGETLGELADHARRFYGLADRVVRTPRTVVEGLGVAWRERQAETVSWAPSEAESEITEHLAQMPEPNPRWPGQIAMACLYRQAAAQTPDVLEELVKRRARHLGEDPPPGGLGENLVNRFLADPGPHDEETFWKATAGAAPPMGEEGEEKSWVATLLRLAQEWSDDVGHHPGRFEAAAEWIESYLDEHAPEEERVEGRDEPKLSGPVPKVVVFSDAADAVERFTGYLHTRLGEEIPEMYHGGLPEQILDDAVERFRHDDDCQVLVCGAHGAEGHDISRADAVVHLDQPWLPARLERRLDQVDRPVDPETREDLSPITSVILDGPTAWENQFRRLYTDVLGMHESASDRSSRLPQGLDRQLFTAWAHGADDLEATIDSVEEDVGGPRTPAESAFRAALEPDRPRLQQEAEFTELLDFVDGIDDALPVRHWARMIGIDDHRVRAGVYDFKWHWSSVRRELEGFSMPEGDDPEEWADAETVRYLSGSFGRRQALSNEDLDFFAPGHLLVDALVQDAMAPTDGRTTVFARRLDGNHRGDVFAVIVARAALNEEVLEDLDVPRGLIRRTHRCFWPETVSAKVKIDLQRDASAEVVEDAELARRLEESYEGPDADQKIEYERLVRAIGNVQRFKSKLDEAVDVGLEALRDDREMLVDIGIGELEEEFADELAYYRSKEQEADEADRQIRLREALIEAVRAYQLDVDSIALVIGGTPGDLRIGG
jgi:hypothetical protein